MLWRIWKLVNGLKEGEGDVLRKMSRSVKPIQGEILKACVLLYGKGSPMCNFAQLSIAAGCHNSLRSCPVSPCAGC